MFSISQNNFFQEPLKDLQQMCLFMFQALKE
jgi:hypothetical protein